LLGGLLIQTTTASPSLDHRQLTTEAKQNKVALPMSESLLSEEVETRVIEEHGTPSPAHTRVQLPGAEPSDLEEEETRADAHKFNMAIEGELGAEDFASTNRDHTEQPVAYTSTPRPCSDAEHTGAAANWSPPSPLSAAAPPTPSSLLVEEETEEGEEEEEELDLATPDLESRGVLCVDESDGYSEQCMEPPSLPRLWSTEDPDAPEFPEQ
jgi:hypothetical protein